MKEVKAKYKTSQRGESHKHAVMTVKLVREMRAMRKKTKLSYAAIAKKFKCSTATVCRICTNKGWTHA